MAWLRAFQGLNESLSSTVPEATASAEALVENRLGAPLKMTLLAFDDDERGSGHLKSFRSRRP